MSIGDIVVVAVLAVCVVLAIIFTVRNKGKCSGNCSGCGMNCKNKPHKE